MTTIRKSTEAKFRNYIDYPYNTGGQDYRHCCGLAATGKEEVAPAETPATELPAKVHNIKTLGYVKTGLALVGLYVVGMFLYKQFKK